MINDGPGFLKILHPLRPPWDVRKNSKNVDHVDIKVALRSVRRHGGAVGVDLDASLPVKKLPAVGERGGHGEKEENHADWRAHRWAGPALKPPSAARFSPGPIGQSRCFHPTAATSRINGAATRAISRKGSSQRALGVSGCRDRPPCESLRPGSDTDEWRYPRS